MSDDALRNLLEDVFGDVGPAIHADLEKVGLGSPRVHPPNPHETAAIGIVNSKTAALCYDRIWSPSPYLPPDVSFFCGTRAEHAVTTLSLLISAMGKMSDGGQSEIDPPLKRAMAVYGRLISDIRLPTAAGTDYFVHRLALDLAQMGVKATPVYRGIDSSQRLYAAGDRTVVTTTLSEIPVVVESRVTWDQVLEFRRDDQSRRNLRRLTHWLDSEMLGKSHAFIADEIVVRRERYQDALKKHGIETVIGALSSTLDSRVLLGGAAAVSALSYAADPKWGLVGGAAILAGKTAISLAQALVNRDAILNERFGEIAFVAQCENIGAAAQA